MATLKQLAAKLDLSVMAVSKALRDAPDISAATKERVRREAELAGYVPNAFARSLKRGSSRLLGLVLPVLNDPVGTGVLRGLQEEAGAQGYDLLVASSQHHEEREYQAVRTLWERRVEAVFLWPVVRVQHRSRVLEFGRRCGLPVIYLDSWPADARQFPLVRVVGADTARAAELAAGHLLEKGHRELLYFSGPPLASSHAAHLGGFKRALRQAGLEHRDEAVFLAGLDADGGRNTTARALQEKVKFTAVVCASDAAALGVVDQLRREGLRVPEDVSVTGMGDGLLAEMAAVPLTTVTLPQVDLGRAAFHSWQGHLAERAGKDSAQAPREHYLPVELRVRKSTASYQG
jgi:LacI family transcriptional regulator